MLPNMPSSFSSGNDIINNRLKLHITIELYCMNTLALHCMCWLHSTVGLESGGPSLQGFPGPQNAHFGQNLCTSGFPEKQEVTFLRPYKAFEGPEKSQRFGPSLSSPPQNRLIATRASD